MDEKRLKENALLRIATSLRRALKECEDFDDLKLSPGEEIEDLHKKVIDMQLELNKKIGE